MNTFNQFRNPRYGKTMKELYGYMPGSSFASQGFTPEEGRASMGLAPTQQEKYNTSID